MKALPYPKENFAFALLDFSLPYLPTILAQIKKYPRSGKGKKTPQTYLPDSYEEFSSSLYLLFFSVLETVEVQPIAVAKDTITAAELQAPSVISPQDT